MKISRMVVLMLILAGCHHESSNCTFKTGDMVKHRSNKSVGMVITYVNDFTCECDTSWIDKYGKSRYNTFEEIE